MVDLNKSIPHYLLLKRNIVKLVVFTALFALLFINLYAPFGVEYWFDIGKWGLLAYSSLVILTGVLVVVISRIIMYQRRKRHQLKLWEFLTWIFAEVLCMALFYSLFEKLILKDDRYFGDMLEISIQNTALVLLLPYSVLWLYFSWQDKKRRLELLENKAVPTKQLNLISFKDERNTLRLSLKINDVLYLESSDNYVNIFYMSQQKKEVYLLRNSLKKLEESLPELVFIRCHRSFLINRNIVKTIKREKEGVFIELESNPIIRIPVSKTYIENVIRHFSN